MLLAFVVWLLIVIDLHGILLAFKGLASDKQDEPAVPEV